jgi:predicted dehydrogenase
VTKEFRVGIVGLGRFGRCHLEAYLKNPRVKVKACSDANPEAFKALEARKVDCKRFTDWHQMLKEETFDLLSVVTNGPSHAEISITAAESKIPRIICEKPMATSIKDAKRMVAAAETNSTRLVINYSRRWAKDYCNLKEKIRKGLIGNLCQIYFTCGGGQLACNGSHFLDLMRFLSDSEPSSVVGFVDKRGTPNPRGPQFTDPGAFGAVRFANGMRGFVDMYEDLGIPPRIEIVGSIGRILINESGNSWTVESRRGKDRAERLTRYDLPLKGGLLKTEFLDPEKLLGNAVAEVLGDHRLSCTGLDGLASLQMVMGFHASDREGNVPVNLPLPHEYEDMAINFT